MAGTTSRRLIWLLPLGIGLVFFAIRATRYDLLLAFYGSFLMLPNQLIADPALLAGHYLRDSILTTMPFAHWGIASLAAGLKLDPLAVEYGRLLALNLLSAMAIWVLSRTLFRDPWIAALSVLLLMGGGLGALGLGSQWTLGDYADWHSFGLVTGLLVVSALYRRAYEWACCLVGFLLWMSPSHALMTGLLTGVVYVTDTHPSPPQRVWRCIALFVFSALPAALYLAPKLPALLGTGVDPSTWWDLARARRAHHLFPLSWTVGTWGAVGLFVLAGLMARHAMLRWEPSQAAVAWRERVTVTLLVTCSLVCAAGLVFSELIPLVVPTKLILFRASNYLEIVLALYLCGVLSHWVTDRRGGLFAQGFVLAAAVVWADLSRVVALPVIFGMGAMAFLLAPKVLEPSADKGRIILATACVVGMTLLHVYLQALPRLTGGAYRGPEKAAPWKEVQVWARDHTSRQAVFINPPDWCGFEVFSGRAANISLCDMGRSLYASQTVAEELRRIRAYSNAPLTRHYLYDSLEAEYEAIRPEGLRQLAETFDASYAIFPKPKDLPFSRVYENHRFIVYRLRE